MAKVNFHEGWYVMYTKPRHEKRVADKFSEQGIECFLPLEKKLRIWHDRRKLVDTPLFPSYVFVYLKDTETYFAGLNVQGVWNYVRSGKEVARVDNAVIENIRRATISGRELEIVSFQFEPGQKLIIKDGPFTGMMCEMVQFKGKDKILVRVDLLQRSLLIALSGSTVTLN
jgi:transcriptional antiterminator RfaH